MPAQQERGSQLGGQSPLGDRRGPGFAKVVGRIMKARKEMKLQSAKDSRSSLSNANATARRTDSMLIAGVLGEDPLSDREVRARPSLLDRHGQSTASLRASKRYQPLETSEGVANESRARSRWALATAMVRKSPNFAKSEPLQAKVMFAAAESEGDGTSSTRRTVHRHASKESSPSPYARQGVTFADSRSSFERSSSSNDVGTGSQTISAARKTVRQSSASPLISQVMSQLGSPKGGLAGRRPKNDPMGIKSCPASKFARGMKANLMLDEEDDQLAAWNCVWLFSKCRPRLLRMLDARKQTLRFAPGETVIAKNVVQQGFYLIEEGSIQQSGEDGEIIGDELNSGDFLGLFSLAGLDVEAPCTYIAGSNGAKVAGLRQKTFQDILAAFPSEESVPEAIQCLQQAHRALRNCDLFTKTHTHPMLYELIQRAEHVVLNRDAELARRGERAKGLYFVLQGRVCEQVEFKRNAFTEVVPIERYGPGALIAKSAIISEKITAPVTVRVTNECLRALCLTPKILRDALLLFPFLHEEFSTLREGVEDCFLAGVNGTVCPISHVPLFAGCGENFLNMISNHCEYSVATSGSVITRQGADADGFYVVQAGRVVVEIMGLHISDLETGSRFGELGMIGGTVRNSVVFRAPEQSSVSLLVVRRPFFDKVAGMYPSEVHPILGQDRSHFRISDRNVQSTLSRNELFSQCKTSFLEMYRTGVFLRLVMPGLPIDGGLPLGEDQGALVMLFKGTALVTQTTGKSLRVSEGTSFGLAPMLGLRNRPLPQVRAETGCVTGVITSRVFEALTKKLAQTTGEWPQFGTVLNDLLDSGMETIAGIHRWPLFEGFNSHFIHILESFVERRVHVGGQVILHVKGVSGPNFYEKAAYSMLCVAFGTVRVEDRHGDAVKSLNRGAVYGELAMMEFPNESGQRLVAECLVDVHVLSRDAFHTAFKEYPDERGNYSTAVARYHSAVYAAAKAAAASDGNGYDGWLSEDMQSLRRCPILKCAGEDLLRELSGLLTHTCFLPDQLLTRQGSRGTCMFILSTGRAALEIDGMHLRDFEEGSVFGELALLDAGVTRTASIRATAICNTRILDRMDFAQAMENHPDDQACMDALRDLQERTQYIKIQQQLRQQNLFSKSNSNFVVALSHATECRMYTPGEVIFTQDDAPPFFMCLLVAGEVGIFVGGSKVGVARAGETFGEVAALGLAQKRTATLRAADDHRIETCVCLVVHESVLNSILDDFPQERIKLQDVAMQKYGVASVAAQRMQAYVDRVIKVLPCCGRAFLFKNCSDDFFEAVANGGTEELTLEEGEVIVEERGDESALFVLLDGEAQLMVDSACVGTLSTLSAIGELSVLGIFTKQVGTVRVSRTCRILRIPAQTIEAVSKLPNFEAELNHFTALREQFRQQVEEGWLREINCFMRCDEICMRIIALHAAPLSLKAGESWRIGPEEHGEMLFVVLRGNVVINIPGQGGEPVTVQAGSVLPDKFLRKHGASLSTPDKCELCLLYSRELLAAVLQFPAALKWFDCFRAEQNIVVTSLDKKVQLNSIKSNALLQHPCSEKIAAWADTRRKRYVAAAERAARMDQALTLPSGLPTFAPGGLDPYGLLENINRRYDCPTKVILRSAGMSVLQGSKSCPSLPEASPASPTKRIDKAFKLTRPHALGLDGREPLMVELSEEHLE